MQIVSSRLGDYVHYRARIAAVFGVESVSKDTEFLNAVRCGLHRRQVYELIIGVPTVYAKVVGSAAPTVHRYHAGSIASVE